jgi:hypothetical protein
LDQLMNQGGRPVVEEVGIVDHEEQSTPGAGALDNGGAGPAEELQAVICCHHRVGEEAAVIPESGFGDDVSARCRSCDPNRQHRGLGPAVRVPNDLGTGNPFAEHGSVPGL